MVNDINIITLCDEIYKGLKAKGCGMTPVEAIDNSDITFNGKTYNGTFTNIVFQALNEARKGNRDF